MDARCVRSIAGSTHQASNRYTGASRGKQCTPTVDFVLDQGDEIYRSVPHMQEYFDYTELPLTMSIPPDNEYVSCSFGTHFSGFMHLNASTDSAMSFPDAVVAACQQAIGCLVTISNTCVAVVRRNTSYYLFDSHSRTLLGMPADNGSAVLLEFSSLDHLHGHMRHLYAIPDNEHACLSQWQQRHGECCQFDVVPVISTVGGPVAQNVTSECSTRMSYASVCKSPSVVTAPVLTESRQVRNIGTGRLSSASVSKVERSAAQEQQNCASAVYSREYRQRGEVNLEQWKVSGSRHDKKGKQYTASRGKTTAESSEVHKFCCLPCGKEYNTKQGLRLHQIRKHGVRSMTDIKQLDCPVFEATTQSVDAFRCSTCGREFTAEKGLCMHMERMHREDKTDAAGTRQSCGKRSVCRVKEQTSDAQFCCSQCGKKCKSLRGVQVHMSKTHGKFSNREQQQEVQKFHGKSVVRDNSGNRQQQEKQQNGQQQQEVQKFHGKSVVRDNSGNRQQQEKQQNGEQQQEVQKVHGKSVVRDNSGNTQQQEKQQTVGELMTDGQFCCSVCHNEFSHSHGLQVHMAQAHGKCSNRTEEKQQTADKLITEYSNGKQTEQLNALQFSCSLCTRRFSSQRGLNLHMSMTHRKVAVHSETSGNTGVQNIEAHSHKFCCSLCSKQFDTQHAVQVHILMVHGKASADSGKETEQPSASQFPCSLCTKYYGTHRGLRLHMFKTHGKTKVCGETSGGDSSAQQIKIGECNVQERNLDKNFSVELNELYKKYLPLNTCAIEQSDSLHMKLKSYHDHLLSTVDNVTTEKLSQEVLEVVENTTEMDTANRKFKWTNADEQRLNMLNTDCKLLSIPENWYWAACENSQQGQFNKNRMEFCMDKELDAKVIHCPQCKSTGILVGLNQINSEVCVDCLAQNKLKTCHTKTKFDEAWKKVQPVNENYPTLVENGSEYELPILTPGEKALIAVVHPVVTVTRNFIANQKFKRECISLLQNSEKTWSKFLPRKGLQNRFMVVERRFKDCNKKYIIANAEKVRQWLCYLFSNHSEYMRMKANNQLEISDEALQALENQSELAEVLYDEEPETDAAGEDSGVVQAAMESGLSKSEVYTFDKYPNLYLKTKQVLKIKDKGKIEIVEDDSERRPTYCASANICFPDLYSNGEMSPLDFSDHTLARNLLKKQTLFAHKMRDGSYRWNYSENSVHMMHQYARLAEQRVHALVGYYISQHPEKMHTPLQSVLKAFKDGLNEDGLLDSQLPDLSAVMSKIPNSRQQWFSERLGIEAISRDLGDPNLFITLNMEPRAWPDVRQLVYKLEHGADSEMDKNWFETNTERFTELLDKFAPQVSIYLCRKAKIFLRAFLCGICRIPPAEIGKSVQEGSDWSVRDRCENSWYWSRVEFTNTRGVQHWHCLAKLPNVLDTALLGRIIHNGRVVRQELKCGNIRPDKTEEAWTMIEMGLLASRYATLFAESVSQASFYTEAVDTDRHDPNQVIDLEKLRQQFRNEYKSKNISVATHPIMRSFNDSACDSNQNVENAKVAAVSCMHHCIQSICGGEEKTGVGCRFSFPKKELRCTVPAIMQVNADQMEAQMLLKRTCGRVPNLNRYFLQYWRANHDVSVLVDAAHKMRYATKYVSKSRKENELLEEVIDYLGKRSNDILPPNMKQALSHLILADSSHREFLSKQELAYKVMDLPEVRKSFSDVSVVGFYPRANLTERDGDNGVITYSDRTEYSAYAERCRPDSECIGFDKNDLNSMCFRDFVETVGFQWKLKKPLEAQSLGSTCRRKVKTRDVDSGHWEYRKLRKRRHVRWSTVLYSEPAHMYEEVEAGKTTSQTEYFDLPVTKRRQLYRAYQELVCYRPWKDSPDESFLSEELRERLRSIDPESESRYSLMKLEAYQTVYKTLWMAGEVAPVGSQWHRDNQYCYSMYLTSFHNNDIRQDRSDNKGVFSARYETADELTDLSVDVRPPIEDDIDSTEVPSVLNFLPTDTFRGILEQAPPLMSDICVAFPLQHSWQAREEMLKDTKASLFIANPPSPSVKVEDMSFWHRKAIELVVSGQEQIVYVYGKAGTGKTEVALHICEHFKDRVQAGAGTGKAASNFNGPTVHAMFGWSHSQDRQTVVHANEATKLDRLRLFYENTEAFVIDEVNAMSASELGLLDETMCKVFDPKRQQKDGDGKLRPFGGKTMVFLGDAAQLRPVCGAAIYDKKDAVPDGKTRRRSFYSVQYKTRTARGQALYAEYLSKCCIWLEHSYRNTGLLLEIFDRVRNGQQTVEDLDKLMYQEKKFPDTQTDYGVHYSNESCSISNWLDLWETCRKQDPPQRLYVMKASYHNTGENDLIVAGLAALPPTQYRFAPDVLCVSEGCEVRLIVNLNVSAGLVNSACGKVIKVIYNNADVQDLLDGHHPPAYCIVVAFPQFRGFMVSGKREFPFSNPNWVPLYRQKFLPQTVPASIRKKQSVGLCYREQFPIDLSRHITAHRGQGQTWKNRLVSVDLGLESPSSHIPPDIGSVIYVACTRTDKLRNLFVRPIFPSIWERIGKSAQDEARRKSEEELKKDAEEFARIHGCDEQFVEEQSFVPDYSRNVEEWNEIVAAKDRPWYDGGAGLDCLPLYTMSTDPDETASANLQLDQIQPDELEVPAWLTACSSERHIGIDQGTKNFAIVAVDKMADSVPRLVGAELYNLQNEGLKVGKFCVSDLVLVLQSKTVLMNWMQLSGDELLLPRVDRVIVHVEQLSVKHRHGKQFALELGRLLQQLADVRNCVVKLSHPHVHKANGPMFKLGENIVRECRLEPAVYLSNSRGARKRVAGSRAVGPSAKKARQNPDVEPDSSSDSDSCVHASNNEAANEYRRKKRMSSAIFQYFVHAGVNEQADLQVDVSEAVQLQWRELEARGLMTKFDDLGDALLHALNEILCGSSNYRPLIPSNPSIRVNRSVVVTVMPDQIFWAVVQCTWNVFTLENVGVSDSHLAVDQTYSHQETVETLLCSIDPSLKQAMQQFTASNLYTAVEHIKIIVKQLRGYSRQKLTNKAAGALTRSALLVMRRMCDEAAGQDSRLCVRNTKQEGWSYVRFLTSGQKLQVLRSTGKHTNAILVFLEWAKEHVSQFVKNRPLHFSHAEKLKFFSSLTDLCSENVQTYQIERLRLSNHVVSMLRADSFLEVSERKALSDLILVALNKNSQYVSALAPNYRLAASKSKSAK